MNHSGLYLISNNFIIIIIPDKVASLQHCIFLVDLLLYHTIPIQVENNIHGEICTNANFDLFDAFAKDPVKYQTYGIKYQIKQMSLSA